MPDGVDPDASDVAPDPIDSEHSSKRGDQSSKSAEPQKPRFLGLDAGNWLSLAALGLSLLTAVWALTGYLIGPQVEMLPPTSVTFRFWPYGGDSLALTATTMNYVNEGRKDYDALVVSEYAVLAFQGRTTPLKLRWWWFVDAFGKGNDHAHPILVPGAGVATHETRFAPTLEPCPGVASCPAEIAYANYMRWIDFLTLAKDDKALPHLDITFVAKVRERSYREITKTCRVAFNDRARQDFASELSKLLEAIANGKRIDEVKDKKDYFSLPCVAGG